LDAFLISTGLVAVAEIGDKTQIATALLAARFEALVPVLLGSTLGMMIANVPAVLLGEALAARLPLKWIRLAAALGFIATGAWMLLAG
jgi:Ca2+/H+ antiporter, TMEM165/GDT1 family